jgi:glucose/arabinose dehydrogenase
MPVSSTPVAVFAALLTLLPAPAVTQSAPAQPRAAAAPNVESLASLEFPWGMAYLPDGRLLITEKPGRLRIFDNGTLSPPVTGLPAISYREGQSEQGGLLDVAVDPDFAQNRRIYLSYAEEAPATAGAAPSADDDKRFAGFLDLTDTRVRGGAVARAVLDGMRLTDLQVIWRQEPKFVGRGHFALRMNVGADGTLFITSGERMRFDPAQATTSNVGKVVRINRDGSIPKDNPFAGKSGARADIYSLGHRNLLAAAVHPMTGKLWVFEMGPLGGDEFNIVEPGRNYGWPVVSDGDNYDKSPIPDHATRAEFEQPKRTWTPVSSPSGALFYDGSAFPWRGRVVVGGLSARGLVVLTMDGERVASEERLDLGRRVRDVIQARDGSILVITDEKAGALLKLTPAAHH